MIRAGVGLSSEPDAARAAIDVAERALDNLKGQPVSFCVAFSTMEHAGDLAGLLDTLREATGTPYLVGCSGVGVLGEGRECEGGPALGLLAVASDRIRATPFMFKDEGDQGHTAGERIGERLRSSRGTSDLVLVWPDPFHVRPDRMLHGIDSVLGGVPVAGGAASSGDPNGKTLQFCGSEFDGGSVSGIRLGGEFSHLVTISQGCRPLGEPLQVTRSHENLILEVDGRPPLEVLRERAPARFFERQDWAFDYLFVATLPERRRARMRPGEYLVRNIVASDPDTGVLAVAERVEEGQFILFALREAGAAKEELGRALNRVKAEKPPGGYRFGLYFNCLARGRSLYKENGVDAALIARALPGVPLLGFFCNAEIAPLRAMNHLFTYTGVLVLVSE